MSTRPASSSFGRWLAPLVAATAALSFAASLRAGLVYDDTLLISENWRVQRWQGMWEAFTQHFWMTDALYVPEVTLVYYRPLVTASFTLDWMLFGGAAWGFHLVNVLLHAAAAYLAARIALRWLERPGLALLVALLFAVHPSRAESVIWIAGRTDVLMTLLCLLSLEAAHVARSAQRPALELGAVAAFAGALLCKEGAAVFPLLLFADMLRDEPTKRSAASKRMLGACLALALAYVLVRTFLYPVRQSESPLNLRYGLMTVATYLERLFWPHPLTFFYRPLTKDVAGPVYPWPLVAVGAAACLAYGLGVLAAWKRDRPAALCLTAALAFLAPVLNFFETGIEVTVSDHFLYLPLLLLALGAARALRGSVQGLPERALAVGGAALALLCLAPNTLRAADFRDNQALWSHELRLDPDSPPALEWLAVELARQGELQPALALLERSLSAKASSYALLSRRALANGRFMRALALRAAMTPDGDRRTLEALYGELRSFATGERGPPGTIGKLQLGEDREQALTATRLNARARSTLSAELAVMASRLGLESSTRYWLERVQPEHLALLPSPLNVILAAARGGDFASALRLLSALERDHAEPELLESLSARLERAERARQAAATAPPERRATLAALSQLELGAYLPACRLLRREYLRDRTQQEVAQLYAQGLIAARLDGEARRVVEAALGVERAVAVLTSLRQALPPLVRDLPPAPDDDHWWQK